MVGFLDVEGVLNHTFTETIWVEVKKPDVPEPLLNWLRSMQSGPNGRGQAGL